MARGHVAAHKGVLIKFDGTPATLTDEPMSLISGKSYRVTTASKRCFDTATSIVVKDNAVNVASANIESIDILNGTVTFTSGYVIVGAITVTGKYVPFSTFGTAKSFSVKVMRPKLDKTVFGNLFRRYLLGLMDTSGSVGAFSDVTETVGIEALQTSLNSGTLRILSAEIIQDGTTLTSGGLVFRSLVNLSSVGIKADVAGIVEAGLEFVGKTAKTPTGASGQWSASWSLLDGAAGLRI